MKRILLCTFLLLSAFSFGQNNARMITGVNVVTTSPYTFVPQDAARLTAFNSASAIAATLKSGLNLGFGAGYEYSVQNVGAGTVTITCSSCLIFSNGTSGASTLALTQGAGADIYSQGLNYYAFAGSGGGGGGCTGSCVNSVFGRGGPTITADAADYAAVGIVQPFSFNNVTTNISVQNNGALNLGNALNQMSFGPGSSSTYGVSIEGASNDAIFLGGSGANHIDLLVGSSLGTFPTLQMNLTDIFMTPDGVTKDFDLTASGLAINVPIHANSGCIGCAGLTLSTNQFVIGAGSGSTVNATAPQGALAYDTVANGGPDLRAMTDADILQGETGTPGSAFVLADQPQFTTNASTPKLTLNGTGPTEWDFTYQATPNAPTANVSKMAQFVSNFLEISQNGFAYSTPTIVMQTSAPFTTSSTTPVTVTGLTSPTIGAGQTVEFECQGLYQFATAASKLLSRLVATQTPQSIWYYWQTDSNTTGGASQRQNATANNTTITPGGNVNAASTNYGFNVAGYIQWNASTAGTFSIQEATNAGADALTIAQGAYCKLTVQ